MGWYKKVANVIPWQKSASAEDIKTRCLQLLNNGVAPHAVATMFVNQMIAIDPSFDTNQMMGLNDAPSVQNFIRGYGQGTQQLVNLPPLPGINQPDTPGEQALDPTPQTTHPSEIQDEIVAPDDETQPADAEAIEQAEVAEELEDGGLASRQLEEPPELGDRVTVDPTIIGTYEVPVSQIPSIQLKAAKINRKLRDLYYPEIKIEFVGDVYNKDIQYKNGRAQSEPYVQLKVNGAFPSPSEEIPIKVKEAMTYKKGPKKGQPILDKDGRPKTRMVGREPMGIRLIAQIEHKALNDADQQRYLADPNTKSSLKNIINTCRQQGVIPYFNNVTALQSKYSFDAKFWYSRPQECFACKDRRYRVLTYIGAMVPPENMVQKTRMVTDQMGNRVEEVVQRDVVQGDQTTQEPVRIVRDEDVGNAPQEQFGGDCISKFVDIKLINAIKSLGKIIQKAPEMDAEKKKKKSYKKDYSAKLPTENTIAVAVSLFRDPRYQKDKKYVAHSLARQTSYYMRSLKPKQPGEMGRYNARISRYAPKVGAEDKQLASDISTWWRNRMTDLELDTADRNKISISIIPTVNTKPATMRDVAGMVDAYIKANNIDLQPLPPESFDTPGQAPEPASEPQTTISDEPVESKVPEAPVAPGEPVPPAPVGRTTVPKGQTFIAKVTLRNIKEIPRRRGMKIYEFADTSGNIFGVVRYKNIPGVSQGDEAYIYGTSYGESNYEGVKSTTVSYKDFEIVSPERVNDYKQKADMDMTGVGAAETPVVPAEPEAPAPEAPAPETLTPEAPAPETPSGLPSWYGKYDLGELVERRLGEGVDPAKVITKFLDSMAMISDKFKDGPMRRSYETVMNRMWQNEDLGGRAALIKAIKGVYNQFRPK